MSWSLSLTEIANKQVECTIVPDSGESGYLEYKFIQEQTDTGVSPFTSQLRVKKVSGHNNGGSISVMSVFESCPETGPCTDANFCRYEVVDITLRGNHVVRDTKQTMNKVSGQV